MAETLTLDAPPLADGAVRARPVETTTLVVENMHCGGCMRKVEAALADVPGIASARANLSARRVTAVHGVRDVAAADLVDALARAGFKAAPLVDETPIPMHPPTGIFSSGSASRALPPPTSCCFRCPCGRRPRAT